VHDTNRRPDDDAFRGDVRACRTLSLAAPVFAFSDPVPQTLTGGRCSSACLLVVIIFLLYFLLNRMKRRRSGFGLQSKINRSARRSTSLAALHSSPTEKRDGAQAMRSVGT
jgi:hypothetical protein